MSSWAVAGLGRVARSLGAKEEEFHALGSGFAGFCAALGGYFLLLPLRDEAAVAIGTDKLPRLFLASLLLTFLATPLASAFLNRSPARERGLQLLFRFLALYSAAGSPHALPPQGHPPTQQRAQRVPGAVALAPAQTAVRVAFFLWVSLLNLVAVSSLWARSADVFSPEQAGRLFGLLGAGATLGQLLGSLAAGALARAPVLGGGAGSPSLLPLLASACMLELAGQAARRFRLLRPGSGGSGGHALEAVGVQGEAWPLLQPPATASLGTVSSKGSLVRHVSRSSLAAGSEEGEGGGGAKGGPAARHRPPVASPAAGATGAAGGGLLEQVLGRALEGYQLIRASPYLMHICALLALNYITSSFFYFEKALVVARVPDAASRTAWFAAINSTSALVILGLQLLATGRMIRRLGVPTALSLLPMTAALLMAGISLRPLPSSVAGAEVARKVLSYSLARPARESLFTVVGRREKYAAKIFLDTVVQRVGDALAAALFQALGPLLGFGPSGMATACVPVCLLWAWVAYQLGLRHQQMAASRASLV